MQTSLPDDGTPRLAETWLYWEHGMKPVLQNVLCNTYNVAPGLVELTIAGWVLGDLRKRGRESSHGSLHSHTVVHRCSPCSWAVQMESQLLFAALKEYYLHDSLKRSNGSLQASVLHWSAEDRAARCLVELRPGHCAASPRGPHPCAWGAAPVAAFVGGVCVCRLRLVSLGVVSELVCVRA